MAVVVAVDIRIEVMITGVAVMEAATITEYAHIYIYLYMYIYIYIYICIYIYIYKYIYISTSCEIFFDPILTYCLRCNHSYEICFKEIYIGYMSNYIKLVLAIIPKELLAKFYFIRVTFGVMFPVSKRG